MITEKEKKEIIKAIKKNKAKGAFYNAWNNALLNAVKSVDAYFESLNKNK